jgi:hypothetical protein
MRLPLLWQTIYDEVGGYSQPVPGAGPAYCLATDRNMLGSKYCAAGIGFSILATRM